MKPISTDLENHVATAAAGTNGRLDLEHLVPRHIPDGVLAAYGSTDAPLLVNGAQECPWGAGHL